MEVGEKIRKLKLVKKIFQKVPYKTIKWLCKCDCGNEKIIADSSIRSGRTVSCGCAKSSRNEYYETKIYLEKMKTKLTRKGKKVAWGQSIIFQIVLAKAHQERTSFNNLTTGKR